jgi:hypothetical protein
VCGVSAMALGATSAGRPKAARAAIMGKHFRASGVLAVAVLGFGPVLAQTPESKVPRSLPMPSLSAPPSPQRVPSTTAQQRTAYEAAFQETLQRPSDPDILAGFAALAVQVGDMEGAISALERLLLIGGDHPEIKLELGVLYYRLGSKEAAAAYLEAVRTSSGASKKVRERAETFLKAVGR